MQKFLFWLISVIFTFVESSLSSLSMFTIKLVLDNNSHLSYSNNSCSLEISLQYDGDVNIDLIQHKLPHKNILRRFFLERCVH